MAEQLYVLRRQGKRFIFEEWHGPRRERQTTRMNKSAVLELLKREDQTGLGARDIAIELGWSRTTVHRRLTTLKSEGLIEVTHKQGGFGCKPFEVYRAVMR